MEIAVSCLNNNQRLSSVTLNRTDNMTVLWLPYNPWSISGFAKVNVH